KGDKALVVRGGKFGERPADICEANGLGVVPMDIEWGASPSPDAIAEALEKDPDIAVVFTTLCETSTGAETDIKAIGEIVGKHKALLAVDGISSVGAVEMQTDEWGVDFLIVGSQKALMLPPGLAFLAVSEKAWAKVESVKSPAFYFSLAKARKKLPGPDTPYTPAITLIRGLEKSLDMLTSEGMESVWKWHALMADVSRAAVKALGLEVFPEHPSNALTVVRVPDGVDGEQIPKVLEAEHGVKIAGGQEHLKGKIFRMSHMGYMDVFDVLITIAALELTLSSLGYSVEPGTGIAAAQRVMAEAAS
ncbi:MAG: alanine--glyoxylate aminotransferase family protein, partial [Planctomycetes bacterium]|nr:alanine--glyoxylate aminotransferase family protein [Planctomycetota bacterium]